MDDLEADLRYDERKIEKIAREGRAPTFAIIGAAGYIAPRHLAAIHSVGGHLRGMCDPSDAVGAMDRHGDVEAAYFNQIERFDRWLTRNPVDYVVVTSPNYLHDAHCRLAMRAGCSVICEKPVTLTERNLDGLREIEERTGQKVYCILQLRRHARNLAKLQGALREDGNSFYIDYQVQRGKWYDYSWKGDPARSGGPLTNIGVHLIDLLLWFFGSYPLSHNIEICPRRVRGSIRLENAVGEIFLQIAKVSGVRREFQINETTANFTGHETTFLHEKEYRHIIRGAGWTLEDARPAIRFCEEVRS